MLSPTSPVRHVLDLAVLSVFCLLQFTFVMGLPWFDNGLWPQVEGPASAIHLLSALLALSAGIQLATKNDRYLAAARSPAVIALFAFAVFSAVLLPFSDDPLRSLHGTLKHGVGVLWQFEMAIATLAGVAIWNHGFHRSVAVWATMTAALVVILLYIFPDNPIGTPLAFEEWSGMLALAAGGVGIVAAGRSRAKGGVTFGNVSAFSAGILVIATGYWVSDNRAVLLAVIAVAALLLLARLPYLKAMVAIPAVRSSAIVLVAAVMTASIYVAGPIIESSTVGSDRYSSAQVGARSVVDNVAIHTTSLGTIWSRSYLERVQVADIVDNPSSLLTGFGFGRFSTAYEYHMREVPGRLFPHPREGASLAYWDAHTSANFHSHNMLSEMVASVGIVGGLLWLSVLAIVAWSSLTGAAIALGIVVVGSFWFPLNHMLGAMAFVYAVSCQPRTPARHFATAVSGCGSMLAVMGLALFGYMGLAATVLGMVERAERGFPGVEVNSNPDTCGFIRTRAFPEKEIVIDLYSILQTRVGMSKNPLKEVFDTSTNSISINCMLRRYYEQHGSIRALAASLKGRSNLVEVGPASFGALRNEIVKWGDDLELLLDMAPERTELVAPYIAVLAKRAPTKVPAEIQRFLPRLQPTDPVRHFLLAVQSQIDKDQNGYEEHFRKALVLGLGSLWPVNVKALSVVSWR